MTTGVRRRMGVEERRQQLISVALDLFSRRSPDEVSIDDIAAAAGISRPLVYHYFPGKLSLYEAALRRASEELKARFTEPHEGPLGARLLHVMHRFFAHVDEYGPGFSALMRGGPAVSAPGSREKEHVSTTNALIDDVRQSAYEQMLGHLGSPRRPAPGAGHPFLDLARRVHRADLAGRPAGSRARNWNSSWCTTSPPWSR